MPTLEGRFFPGAGMAFEEAGQVWGSGQIWGSSCTWVPCVLPNSREALAFGAPTSKSREGRLAKVSRVPHCAWLCQEVRLMGTGGPENAH